MKIREIKICMRGCISLFVQRENTKKDKLDPEKTVTSVDCTALFFYFFCRFEVKQILKIKRTEQSSSARSTLPSSLRGVLVHMLGERKCPPGFCLAGGGGKQ